MSIIISLSLQQANARSIRARVMEGEGGFFLKKILRFSKMSLQRYEITPWYRLSNLGWGILSDSRSIEPRPQLAFVFPFWQRREPLGSRRLKGRK
jgi:hypothetical protein